MEEKHKTILSIEEVLEESVTHSKPMRPRIGKLKEHYERAMALRRALGIDIIDCPEIEMDKESIMEAKGDSGEKRGRDADEVNDPIDKDDDKMAKLDTRPSKRSRIAEQKS